MLTHWAKLYALSPQEAGIGLGRLDFIVCNRLVARLVLSAVPVAGHCTLLSTGPFASCARMQRRGCVAAVAGRPLGG